ncbi:MAG: hypothetical protein CM1200mP22_05500 [Dehalococcoidia bacterium]|nr:MAG: hypothetical protein CM1200mP22_05500 [Dehalococcoidia bacterium]
MLEQLKAYFGFAQIPSAPRRYHQQGTRETRLLGADAHWRRKSLCYQLPAIQFRGLTLVVSPLIALMKDQVDGLKANGVPPGLLNSTLSPDESPQVQDQARRGELKMLYVAPERLTFPGSSGSCGLLKSA